MARIRQARRCRAHRTNGEPCRAWAIRGGYVCRAHGGATWAARIAAERRLEIGAVYREMAAADKRHQEDVRRWRIDQIVTTAELLGIEVEDVTRLKIALCSALHGVPSLQEPPRRKDRRYGRRKRPDWAS